MYCVSEIGGEWEMVTLDTSIVLDIHIVLRIAIAFSVIAVLFSACTAIIRFAHFNVKQARHIEIKIFNFYIKREKFKQLKRLSGKRPKKNPKDTEVQLDSKKSMIDLTWNLICWTDDCFEK
jgi:hypothetical protein